MLSRQTFKLLNRVSVCKAEWQLLKNLSILEISCPVYSLSWAGGTVRNNGMMMHHSGWSMLADVNPLPVWSPDARMTIVRSIFGHSTPTTYDERKLIGYSPERMFKVVSQVEDYHKFVPWCVASNVIKRNPTNYIECDLEVGFQVFVERYTSKIRLNPPHSLTTVTDDSTLFHHLETLWKFEKGPVPDSCWLSFHVDFAFKSPLYKHVANVFFEEVVKRMMTAFIGRCEVLYGPSSLSSSRNNKSVRIA